VCYRSAGMTSRLAGLALVVVTLAGCSTMRTILGVPSPGDPSVNLKSAEARWLLIKNPRFGDVPSEPEYIWVEEDKVPFTVKGMFNKNALVATPEIVAQYGSPPGGGKISPRQGVPYAAPATTPAKPPERETRVAAAAGGAAAAPSGGAAAAPSTATAGGAPAPSTPARAAGATSPVTAAAASPTTTNNVAKHGMVVHVEASRIVLDLTAADGVKPGSLVSIRRDTVPIVHPVTGELLGELDEEVGTVRVTELREKFSVAEVQSLAQGSQVQVRDRAVPK
jgi:flagellar assembly FlgT-like protein